MKFDPRAQLSIEISPNAAGEGTQNVVLNSPELTIDFQIVRNSWGSSQTAEFRIHNLGEKTRNLIYKDPYAVTSFRQAIQFRAGYRDSMPMCFNGFVQTASSDRQGEDVFTTITAFDGGLSMSNGFVSQSFEAGSVKQRIIDLAKQLPHTTGNPIVGNFTGDFKRGQVFLGNAWQIILGITNGFATIDNGQIKALQTNEVVNANIGVINSASGLLGSPRRLPTSLEVTMLFEPNLSLGALVQLETRISPANFNGTYKVQGFTHRGTISPSVSGTPRVSVVQLFFDKTLVTIPGNLVQ